MKKVIVSSTFLLFLLTSSISFAVNCEGYVYLVIDYPNKCPGNLAFQTTNASGAKNNNSKWICSLSSGSDALVLTALTTNREITFKLSGVSESCSALTGDYLVPTYMYTKK